MASSLLVYVASARQTGGKRNSASYYLLDLPQPCLVRVGAAAAADQAGCQ